MNQIKLISTLIDNLNNMYAEEGTYKFWTLSVVDDKHWLFSHFELDIEKDEIVNLKWFSVRNVNIFFNVLKSNYEKDGGDNEYNSIVNWTGFEQTIEAWRM